MSHVKNLPYTATEVEISEVINKAVNSEYLIRLNLRILGLDY